MTCYFVTNKKLRLSYWRMLNFYHFDGLKLNLYHFIIALCHFIIAFICGAKIHFYMRVLANLFCFLLNIWCKFQMSFVVHLCREDSPTLIAIYHFNFLKKMV